jgi:hypothetical protein
VITYDIKYICDFCKSTEIDPKYATWTEIVVTRRDTNTIKMHVCPKCRSEAKLVPVKESHDTQSPGGKTEKVD